MQSALAARPHLTRLCGSALRLGAISRGPARQQHRRGGGSGAAPARAFSSGAEMPLQYRPPIVVQPREKHTATVIMLHGLGDSGDGWAAIGDEFAPATPHVKYIFPHSPLRSITINMGMKMPGWFDIVSLEDIDASEDGPGLVESKRYVESLVAAEEAAGVPSERVVVAGFSQGGAVALMMLRSERKLAGIVGLSTWLPLRNEEGVISAANAGTPVLQCHGDADGVVAYSFGVATNKALKALGADAEFLTVRGMGHSAVPSELEAVQEFIKRVVPPA
ncbi:phospholipase carboxylesterase [Raphidocelis subcapitata]|uniref:Phospholipase carboxylesterase n=1 Tax=Raphidocelis subcapitata TaxID=307507 RepID=A0A2V0PE11_9CHLO|nr:phospholipase carboxylesterase [Raphidocelis subcapitata]|eukprot:GBF96133.1 phospholipase carboxylesterase [Raphidocelis subcapitata]